MSKRVLGSVSLTILAALLAMPVAAQTAPIDAPAGSAEQSPAAADKVASAPTESDTGGLGDIVVTAQRRTERLQDVPLSVTAVSAEDLNRIRITDASRLQLLAPGLTWGQQGSDSFPAIRGVRTQLVSAQSDPVIGFYLDGIYQSRTQQQSIPLFDVARVEVQRGPQGTLYGRNTFGGNLSVTTNAPSKRFEAGANGTLGNYDLRQFDGYLNLPISDSVQLRMAGYHSQHDGYVRSTAGFRLLDEDQTALRGAIAITLTPQIQIDMRGGYWERDNTGGGAYGYRVGGTLINPATGLRSINGQPFAVNPSARNGSNFVNGVDIGVSVTDDPYTNSWDYKPFERLKQAYGSGSIAFDLGFATLRSITGYTDFEAYRSADLDQTSVVFPATGTAGGFAASGLQAAHTYTTSVTQEVQLASAGSSAFEWIVGGYYFHDKITEYYQQVYTTGTTGGTESRTDINTKAYAAYGQASLAIVPDTLKIIGGVRYSDESKGYLITNFTAPAGTFNFNTQTAARATGEPSFNKVTWKGGVEFTPTRRMMLYGTVSTGFSSGGINNNSSNAAIPFSYAPQTVTAYEVGSKNTLLGGRMILNLSAFYNDYKNLQITILDQRTNLSYYASAGAARSYGAEVELRTLPFQGLHVDLTGALLDAQFTAYTRPNPFYTATNGDPLTVNLAGKDVPMSPTFKGTASVYYDLELGGGSRITPAANVLYSTSYYSTDYNTRIDKQDAYALLDANLRWTSASSSLYVEAFGTNLTKKAVLYSSTVGNNQRIQQSYGPPRVYGLRVGVRY
ncbi:TonB-dependent receptor [Sphingomonas floccifaciens]|uniref:TonB-dependent receptor n=1 Tax=Sphingomonas floccifaciens TaxID=1844115 RepID=A0ABW4NJD4_9SPHN